MTTDTTLPHTHDALSHAEAQICAHDQVGQLAPFVIQRLRLAIDPQWSAADICRAATEMIATNPVFATRLVRQAGGAFRRKEIASHQIAVSEVPIEEFETILPKTCFLGLRPAQNGQQFD